MSENLTAEQVRAAKIAAMPAPLGEIHYELWNEVAWMHMKWTEYRALYAANPETITLLNQAAPAFFHHLQRVLWEDVLLHLCRLTDPVKSVGKSNLSLACLPSIIPDLPLRAMTRSTVEVARQKSSFARDWRNRRLAHKELPPLSGQQPMPLASASRQNVEDALAAIRAVMNCVEHHYQKSSVAYEHFIEPLGGAASLVFYLRKGVDAQKREDDALLARKTNHKADPRPV